MIDDGGAAFAELYEPLRRFAAVVRSRDMDADDLVQEALVRTLALQSFARARADLAPESVSYPSDLADLWRLDAGDRAAVYLAVVEHRSHRAVRM